MIDGPQKTALPARRKDLVEMTTQKHRAGRANARRTGQAPGSSRLLVLLLVGGVLGWAFTRDLTATQQASISHRQTSRPLTWQRRSSSPSWWS